MIVYVTGAPGSGKTLWTITTVQKLQRESDPPRPVYYSGIPQVAPELGWIELSDDQARDPQTLPHGSICIVDEAWRLWPQSGPGMKVPPNIEAFATHRHRGHDFYILTQRATSVHHFIRGLVGQHVHLERQFGLPRSRRFEWQRMGNPSDKWDKDAASGSEFIFPRDVFKLYKSADVHTVKVRLPWKRFALIGALCLAVAVAFWRVYALFGDQHEETTASLAELQKQSATQHAELKQSVDQLALAALEWSGRFAERVPGQPHSAAFYDPLVQPVAFPKISGCSHIRTLTVDRCECTSQQGTKLTTITPQQCKTYIAQGGWFDFTQPDIPEPDPAPLPGQTDGGQGAAAGGSGAPPPPPSTLLGNPF